MAEALIPATDKDDVGGEWKRNKPPDRKKFEEELDILNAAIKSKEVDNKSVGLRTEDSISLELRGIRAEKEATIARRKHIDNDLSRLNQEIKKEMEALTKTQTNLPYKNEDRINEAIRRLEQQLKMQNFSLREEKKIVAEIDRLKRSKKSLVQYSTLKQEINGMRDRQRRMREERDRYYKTVTQLKTREEELKKKNQSNRNRAEETRKEMDDFYEQRRQLIADFKKQEREWQDSRNEYRKRRQEETQKKQEEERLAQFEAFQQELAEYEASREPYEDEKQLCLTLIAYLQPHIDNMEMTSNTPTDQSHGPTHPANQELPTSQDAIKELENEGMYVLKKKDDDLFGGLVRPKANKRSKREKRKSFHRPVRPIVHAPQIFAQFAQLNLSAPSNISEVPASIKILHEKKKYYDSLPPPVKPAIHVDAGQTESNSDGVSESVISESIPSTPEVQFDNTPPRFPRPDDKEDSPGLVAWPRPRRLSRDSGAWELEGPNSCDENNTNDDQLLAKDIENRIPNGDCVLAQDALDTPSVMAGTNPAAVAQTHGQVVEAPTDVADSSRKGLQSATQSGPPKLSLNVNCTASSGQVVNCDNCQTDVNSNPDLRLELRNENVDCLVNKTSTTRSLIRLEQTKDALEGSTVVEAPSGDAMQNFLAADLVVESLASS